MKYVGPHVSISGGVQNAPVNAKGYGARAFGMFLKNQRQWKAKPYDEETIAAFDRGMLEQGYGREHVLVHDTYLINLCSPDPEKRQKSLDAFIDEASRAYQLGLRLLNFHPGAHLKQISEEEAVGLVVDAIDTTCAAVPDVNLVVETTAGQGSNIGYTFELIAEIVEGVRDRSRVGVCMDTCHIFAAGYDIRTEDAYRETMRRFDDIVGFSRLKGVHLNDAKSDVGSRVDRHESLGAGALGWDLFARIMKDERFDSIPIVLETPKPELWSSEVTTLYSFIS
jgi:deoxyribonuclease-4